MYILCRYTTQYIFKCLPRLLAPYGLIRLDQQLRTDQVQQRYSAKRNKAHEYSRDITSKGSYIGTESGAILRAYSNYALSMLIY